MKVLFVSAEAAPFAKVGGLADVAGSLPSALRQEGADVRVIMPGYGFIPHNQYNISRLFSFSFDHSRGRSDVHIYTCVRDGVPHYFIQVWPYFGQDSSVYTQVDWDVPRFVFFNQVVPAVIAELQERLGWMPDIVHVNDWHTSLLPYLISQLRSQPMWAHVRSVLSIHNIAYQGDHVGRYLWDAGIPQRNHPLLDRDDLTDNLLGIAIAYADQINTVSPRYAEEIQYETAGFNLAGLIRERKDDLVGILNGLDIDALNPSTDPSLIASFNSENFKEQRINNKRHLQSYARLPIRDDVPLIGIVSRLTWQKGFDFALPALFQLMSDTDVQMVILGTGEPNIEDGFRELSNRYRDKCAAFITFDNTLAQHIYAGSDLFLMPSHFEPCGIGQMIAMRYGSLPLVRETGGLADTVTNYDNAEGDEGTGFLFRWEEPDAILGTLRWALNTYYERPKAWRRMQRRAMQVDFAWRSSAQKYISVYKKALDKGEAS